MIRRVITLLVALALACAAVSACAEETPEAYFGIWHADGLAVRIWQEEETVRARAVFTDGAEYSDIWEYGPCLYDGEASVLWGMGVTRTRERFDAMLDEVEELDWSLNDMCFAEFRLSEGELILTDEDRDTNARLTRWDGVVRDERTATLAFLGQWRGESAALRVEDHGACCRFTLTVPVDADTDHRFSYLCRYDPQEKLMAAVDFSPLAVITRVEDGTVEEEEGFPPIGAEFALEGDDALIWTNAETGERTALARVGG